MDVSGVDADGELVVAGVELDVGVVPPPTYVCWLVVAEVTEFADATSDDDDGSALAGGQSVVTGPSPAAIMTVEYPAGFSVDK